MRVYELVFECLNNAEVYFMRFSALYRRYRVTTNVQCTVLNGPISYV